MQNNNSIHQYVLEDVAELYYYKHRARLLYRALLNCLSLNDILFFKNENQVLKINIGSSHLQWNLEIGDWHQKHSCVCMHNGPTSHQIRSYPA
jgi:hypothetical protein